MKKLILLVLLPIILAGCINSSKNFIPKGLAPEEKDLSAENQKQKEELLRQEQARIIEEGTLRRNRQRTHTIFLEAYKILKSIPIADKTPYLEVLTSANNIPEIRTQWKTIDEEVESKQPYPKLIEQTEILKKQCTEIQYCQNNLELTNFLSLLKNQLEKKTTTQALTDAFTPFIEVYFNETNLLEKPQKPSPEEIASFITQNEFENKLQQKHIIKNICPKIKETFKTSEEYNTFCGEKALKKFETYKAMIKKELFLSAENSFCAEFMTLLKKPNCDPINTNYTTFRKTFLDFAEAPQ